MGTMKRTVWAEDPDGNSVKLLRGSEAPEWFSGRHVDNGEGDDETGSHPAAGGDGLPPVPEMSGDQIVQGTVDVVKERVGDNPDLAAKALEAEQRGQQRSSLISALESTIAAAEGDDDEDE